MLSKFLLPEPVTRQNGTGPVLELDRVGGEKLLLTLGITRIIEQESLDVEVWGSGDKFNWGDKPLVRFPQKFYCGTYSMPLDLAKRPDVKYLRIAFKLNRWGRADASPLFGFYVYAQEASQAATAFRAAVA